MNRAILVKSCQKNHGRRLACIATWLGALWETLAEACFVVGGCKRVDAGQGLIALGCGDEYGDNSIKVRESLRQLLTLSTFDQLFICDDDTFIYPERWLAHEPAGEFECRLHRPMTDREMKLNTGRPWANGGSGWHMSRRLCEMYVEKVTERCSWDDVLASRIAQDAGVEIVDRPDLYGCDRYGDSAWRAPEDSGTITCHPVEPTEMVEMWESLKCTV